MEFTFEIDDALVPSIEQYLQAQVRVTNDEVTGAQRMTRVYADVSAFIHDALGQVVHQVVQQYPPDHIRERMAQAKAIQDGIKKAAMPRLVGRKG